MDIKIESGANVQITDKPIVNVYGDVVQHKEVHIHSDEKTEPSDMAEEARHTAPACSSPSRDEEQFHFIHPELNDEEAWRIHDAVKRVVVRQKVTDICLYLKSLKQEGKLLLPQSPGVAYRELVRMGMPTGEGFSEKHFSNSYTK